MPERFIFFELDLCSCGLSERDFSSDTLTDDQKRRLDEKNLLAEFDKIKPIRVKREATRHGITLQYAIVNKSLDLKFAS